MISGSASRLAYTSMEDRAANLRSGRHLTRTGLQCRRIRWLSLVTINRTPHTSRTMSSLLVLCEDLHSWRHRRSMAGSRMKIAGTSTAEHRIRFHPDSRWHGPTLVGQFSIGRINNREALEPDLDTLRMTASVQHSLRFSSGHISSSLIWG